MKTYFSILVIAVSALVWECSPKKHEKTAEEIAATADSIKNVEAAKLADRKAKLKELRESKEQQRRSALAEKAKGSPTYKDANGNVVYYMGEVQPSYTGGNDEMFKYLNANLKYPEAAINNRDEGTVFVDFVVDKKGKVRDVIATESTWEKVDSTLVREAMRVVSEMPVWVAGTQKGKAVDVAYSIPITFELDN
jgi:TonB family protein